MRFVSGRIVGGPCADDWHNRDVTLPGAAIPSDVGRSLRPSELAQASVMAALCAALAIIAVVVPFAGGLSLLGTVPMGLLAYRYRIRVLVAATFAAGVVGFLIAGISGLMVVVNCAYVGGLAGIMKRRGRGTPTVIAVVLWRRCGLRCRGRRRADRSGAAAQLTFHTMTANFDGVVSVMARVRSACRRRAPELKRFFGVALDYWPWLLLGYAIFSIMVVSLVGWWALSRVLDRLRGIPDVHKLDAPASTGPSRRFRCGWTTPGSATRTADHDALRP